jgi:hypothetical protein
MARSSEQKKAYVDRAIEEMSQPLPGLSHVPAIPDGINLDLRNARLPETYNHAKTAMAECAQTDECKAWSDKAEALRAYAKMQDDTELEDMAKRIKARAIHRASQLMAEFQSKGGRPPKRTTAATRGSSTQGGAAREAGFSEHQERQARDVGAIPKEKFEALVDGPNPPTIPQLAEIGRREKSTAENQIAAIVGDRDPKDFNTAMHLGGMLRRVVEESAGYEIASAMRGIDRDQVAVWLDRVETIRRWLDRVQINLKERFDDEQ